MYNNIDSDYGTVSDFELGANESAIRFIEQNVRDSLPEQHTNFLDGCGCTKCKSIREDYVEVFTGKEE